MISPITIAIDFDGTCVTHEFPIVGKDIGAEPVLKKLVAAGHQLILWTMRADEDSLASRDSGDRKMYLTDAVDWFKARNIPLWGTQTNPEQKSWTSSPKAYAQLYIDDAALGTPLTKKALRSSISTKDSYWTIPARPYVDWVKVEEMLVEMGLISH